MTPNSKTPQPPQSDLRELIGNTLRIGVFTAALVALVGGILYLVQHGAEPRPDYSHFAYTDAHDTSYTTLSGILQGALHFTATGWIQLGVIILFLTPILRVLLSLLDFVRQRDWLYSAITATVLAVIIVNSLA